MTPMKMTRRSFLRLGSAALVSPMFSTPSHFVYRPAAAALPASLGRIAAGERQAVRSQASLAADWVAWRSYDDVIPLVAAVEGEAPWPSNPIWYQTDGGYIHSALVQPVEDAPNGEVVAEIEKPGMWVQVCVPIAEARVKPDSPKVSRKLYYGTIYRAASAMIDASGKGWYQLREGIVSKSGVCVPAWSVRRIAPEDLTPLSPGQPDKRIVIDLQSQALTCFEGDTAVFSTVIASGGKGRATPRGKFRITIKRHTDHLAGGSGDERYNLPGVPFPVYFTDSGVAIHGTYWHNDYGRPRSHGCVNVPNPAARWIFRWAEPAIPYQTHSLYLKAGVGTPISVV